MSEKSLKNSSKMFMVVGNDSYFGNKITKHLTKKYQFVHGYLQDEEVVFDIKDISIDEYKKNIDAIVLDDVWIVICLDSSMGFEKYIKKLKTILDDLDAMDFSGHICFFSSASICQLEYDKAISEESLVSPRNEHDLCLATAENLLHVLSCSDKSYIEPHIFRVGIPYGDNSSNFINSMLETAQNGNEIKVPFGSDVKRTLTHIDDVCEAAIELMELEFCPQLINIAGETKSINEIGSEIANKYNVEFIERGLNTQQTEDFFAGDQHLSDKLFNETVNFNPKHNFSTWLKNQK